jgi:hypothetical protein
MFFMHACDQGFRSDAFTLGAQHDGRAMGIIGADVNAIMTPQPLIAGPDVGLGVFNQVAKVNRTIGVGQGAGNQDAFSHSSHKLQGKCLSGNAVERFLMLAVTADPWYKGRHFSGRFI